MANRGPPWKTIGVVFAVVTVAAMSSTFLLPGPLEAPRDAGVCWRMGWIGKKPTYHRIGGDIANLETCAAYLESEFLRHGGKVDGAFQGRFIFIDEDAVRSAVTLDGSRWRVFFQPQRLAVDRKIREGGKTLNVFTGPASQGP